MKDKMQIICNQITILELTLKQLISRPINKEMTTQQYHDFLNISMESLVLPILDKIKYSGQKMEVGLVRRKKFLELHNLEDKYMEYKNLTKNNK
jgi:hypothetical protein